MATVILQMHFSLNDHSRNLHYYEQFVNLSLRKKHCALKGFNDDLCNCITVVLTQIAFRIEIVRVKAKVLLSSC